MRRSASGLMALGGLMMTVTTTVTTIVTVAIAPAAYAQASDVPALIKLIDEQPAGMDRTEWKDRRREAAKRLGASGDRRAVPVLIRLVDVETFDIIGEIAIEGLGQLGDPQAVAALQKVAGDPSRDRAQRDLAKKALAKLGAAAPAAPAPTPPPRPAAATPASPTAPAASTPPDAAAAPSAEPGTLAPASLGAAAAPPAGPELSPDTLGESERITLALGSARLAYDSVRERTSLDGNLAAHYLRRIDRRHVAWAYGGDGALVAGSVDPKGVGKNRGGVGSLSARGEGRGYSDGGFYVMAALTGGLQATYVAAERSNANDDLRDVRTGADAAVEFGPGWGRILDVGARQRARRLAAVLERNHALGRPIDDALAERLQRAWGAQRAALGSHGALVATVALLREAGVLLGEPDAGLTYELLEVLRDPGLDDRASGFDTQLVLSVGYLVRDAEDNSPLIEDGRFQQLLVRSRLARQLPGDVADVGIEGFARLRVLAGDGVPAPWAVGATGRLRRFAYGEHLDPRGVLDVSASVAISDDDLDVDSAGLRVGGSVGWSVAWSRASWLRVAADAAVDAGELFLGASLEARYGVLDAVFARSL